MKATYVGNPDLPKEQREIPDTFVMYDISFEKGKATDIPADLEAKFVGNSHFETSGKETEAK